MTHKNKKNIIFIGFMGCGKTSVGKRLALTAKKNFMDTDFEIQKTTNMTINDIFEKYGESYFRRLERNLCKQIAFDFNNIIATGGGIIKDVSNVENLKINGTVVYLKSTPEKIYNNLKNNTTRPLLNNTADKLKTITELLEQRRPLYEKYADITCDVSSFDLDESVEFILKRLTEAQLI